MGISCTLHVNWYFDINVTNSTNTLTNANVTVYNANNQNQFSELTVNGSINTKTYDLYNMMLANWTAWI